MSDSFKGRHRKGRAERHAHVRKLKLIARRIRGRGINKIRR